MKKIILKTIVEIDGVQHVIKQFDYSHNVDQVIKENEIDDTNADIIDYVQQDAEMNL